jgi:NAD(P)-dependent dehydrogenase (short-subunit alcohol dehydrogenase family)
MSLLDGQRVLVTGGSTGIGAEIVKRFTAQGATGVVLDLDRALQGAALPLGWSAEPVDVRDETSIATALEAAGGTFDILVAAAGIVPPWATTTEVDLDVWDAVMGVNARGLMATLKHAAPRMTDGGAIVVIGSLNSWRGDGNIAAYVASKHAALGIVRAAALDLGKRGIRVNAVAPGPIATDALLDRMRTRAAEGGLSVEQALEAAAAGTALGQIATTAHVADAALFLASGLGAGVTGHLLPVDGGIS